MILAASGVAQPASPGADAESGPGLQGWGKAAHAQRDVGVWVVEGDRAAAVSGQLEQASATRSAGLRSIESVSVVVKGKAHDVVTNAATVGQLLSAMRIEPDADDVVAPPPSTPLSAAPRVVFATVVVRRVRRVEAITPEPVKVFTDDLPHGVTELIDSGRPGQEVRTYRVRLVNGRLVTRSLLSRGVLRSPVRGRELVGTASGSMVGEASWYDIDDGLAAASPWLPFGTRVTVTNVATGASVTVVINDRGPFGGRIIDLSREAFTHIAPLGQGVCEVRISW